MIGGIAVWASCVICRQRGEWKGDAYVLPYKVGGRYKIYAPDELLVPVVRNEDAERHEDFKSLVAFCNDTLLLTFDEIADVLEFITQDVVAEGVPEDV